MVSNGILSGGGAIGGNNPTPEGISHQNTVPENSVIYATPAELTP